jgi:hypothetical protein
MTARKRENFIHSSFEIDGGSHQATATLHVVAQLLSFTKVLILSDLDVESGSVRRTNVRIFESPLPDSRRSRRKPL